jgi:Cu-Zn family superoxide dismutase
LGNLSSDPFGNSYICFKDEFISLFGDQSIIGRSVAITADKDDFGQGKNDESHKTGNSGKTIASGVIGLSNEFKMIPPAKK